MHRRPSAGVIIVLAALVVIVQSLGDAVAYAGWQLDVTFTTSSPGGDLKFDPKHVHAVWVEDYRGVFVKTIGRWGVLEHKNLTQWMAADGTNIDGWTGATPGTYREHTTSWDMTNRSGSEVPDGSYNIVFELTNHNADKNQFHRTSFRFDKTPNPSLQSYTSQDGFYNVSLNYYYNPTLAPQLSNESAQYVDSDSARLRGRIVDTGGEGPVVRVYWGDTDGGADPVAWEHVLDFNEQPEGPLHADIAGLDASTTYYYRFYAENSAGGQWASGSENFRTDGPTGYYKGYRVQSGRVNVTGSRLDVKILPVNDTSRAFALISYGTGWQPDVDNASVVMVRGQLFDEDTVRIERRTGTNSTWVSWQVIECFDDEFKVYRGEDSFTASQNTADLLIDGSGSGGGGRSPISDSTANLMAAVNVDPANCMAYVTADTSSAARTVYHEAMLTAYVNSSTTLRVQRGASGHSSVTYNWIVVEFDPAKIGSVQHGSVSFSGPTEASPATRTISSVSLASSIVVYQSRSNVNGLAYCAIAGRLTSPTTVQFYQHTGTSGTRNVEYHVIDFGPRASSQRGQVDYSNDMNWTYADCSLARAVDTSRAMYFHQHSCNGTGDYFPRPYSTAEFTSDTNLRIERQFMGQQSFIEWQVLELPALTFFPQEADISVSPTELDFPDVDVGAFADKNVDIGNTGDADLQINSLEITGLSKGAYSLVGPPGLPMTITPTSSVSLTVRFAPNSNQSYEHAALAVGCNDPDAAVMSIPLAGRGDSSAVSQMQNAGAVGGAARAVAIYGDYVLLGQGGVLTVLDVSVPSSPEPVANVHLGGAICDISVLGQFAYAALESRGIVPVGLANPALPQVHERIHTSGYAYDISAGGSRLVVAEGHAGLSVCDLSVPSVPAALGVTGSGRTLRAVESAGDIAYALDDQTGLAVFHVAGAGPYSELGVCDEIEFGRAMAVKGTRACVVDALGGFFVVDVSNPAAASVQSSIRLTQPGRAVCVEGSRAYVAEGYGAVQIVDLSNAIAPQPIGEILTGGFARDISVSRSTVYVADSEKGLCIFDLTSGSSPSLLAVYNVQAEPYDVRVADSLVYSGRVGNGVQVLEVSFPSTAVFGAIESLLAGDIHVDNRIDFLDYARLAETWLQSGLGLTGDIDGDETVGYRDLQSLGGSWLQEALFGRVRNIVVAGNSMYLANGRMGLQIVDISDPGKPHVVGSFATDGYACSVAVQGFTALVADGGSVYVLDVSDASAPALHDIWTSKGRACGVAVSGQYAYIANGGFGLSALDLSDLQNVSEVGFWQSPGTAWAVTVVDSVAYVADGPAGLQIVDISQPLTPTLLGGLDTPGTAVGLSVSGTEIYLADGLCGVCVIDVSNPSSPNLSSKSLAPLRSWSTTASGAQIFIADDKGGLAILSAE